MKNKMLMVMKKIFFCDTVEIELYNSVRKFKPIKSTSLLISGINVPFRSNNALLSDAKVQLF